MSCSDFGFLCADEIIGIGERMTAQVEAGVSGGRLFWLANVELYRDFLYCPSNKLRLPGRLDLESDHNSRISDIQKCGYIYPLR